MEAKDSSKESAKMPVVSGGVSLARGLLGHVSDFLLRSAVSSWSEGCRDGLAAINQLYLPQTFARSQFATDRTESLR